MQIESTTAEQGNTNNDCETKNVAANQDLPLLVAQIISAMTRPLCDTDELAMFGGVVTNHMRALSPRVALQAQLFISNYLIKLRMQNLYGPILSVPCECVPDSDVPPINPEFPPIYDLEENQSVAADE